MLKIGDKVKIKPITWWINNKFYSEYLKEWIVDENNDHRTESFWFGEEMVKYLDKIATITKVSNYSGGHYYDLDIDVGAFAWKEFMFEDILSSDDNVVEDFSSDHKTLYTLVSFGDLYIAVNLLTKVAIPKFFEDDKEFYEYCKKEGI